MSDDPFDPANFVMESEAPAVISGKITPLKAAWLREFPRWLEPPADERLDQWTALYPADVIVASMKSAHKRIRVGKGFKSADHVRNYIEVVLVSKEPSKKLPKFVEPAPGMRVWISKDGIFTGHYWPWLKMVNVGDWFWVPIERPPLKTKLRQRLYVSFLGTKRKKSAEHPWILTASWKYVTEERELNGKIRLGVLVKREA